MSTLYEVIAREKIVAILRGVPKERLEGVILALHRGGIRLLEITFDQRSNQRHEETGEAIRLAKRLCPDLHVGAGTVMSTADVNAAFAAGAEFVLAPNVNREVIGKAVSLGMMAIPGAMTPTEIVDAYACGAEIVKLFPAGDLGLSYVKSVMAPVSHVPLMAVGGVDLGNVKEFLAAGMMSAGIGSALTNRKLIADGDWDGLTALARQYVEAARG